MVSGLDGRNRKDYSKYNEMSTESLEEFLRLDAELPDGEESDIDEILYISEVIAKREREHPTGRYSEVDVDAAWETFQTKYLPYLKDGRSLYDFDDDESSNTEAEIPVSGISPLPSKKRISPRSRRSLRRVASFAAAIALLLGLMTATAYAMGFDLWGIIAQWTKETFTFASGVEDPNENSTPYEGEYKDLQAALDAYGVTEILAPKWIPEPFELELVYIEDMSYQAATMFYAFYECDDRSIVIQINMYKNSDEVAYATWQKDGMDVDTIRIADCTFYRMQNSGRECVSWVKGTFECNINGDISSDEMLKMLESIFE